MKEHQGIYGIDDLVRFAKDANLEVSPLQVGEWHRSGLLPDPVPPPGPKKRGRPRLFFAEPTPRVVCSLARWRRLVTGAENARGWLWLEGFEHLGLDPDAEFAAWLRREWAEYRKTFPSLPESPEAPIDHERRETILDEFDANYVKPESDKHGVPPEWFAAHPALLGLYSKEEWRGLEKQGAPEPSDEVKLSEALLAGMYEGGQSLFGRLPYNRDEMLTGPSGDPAFLSVVGLPGFAREPNDWSVVRAMWQFVCIVTNVHDAPEVAEHIDFPRWRPLAAWLRKVRYHAYSHFEPWYVATILASVSKALPENQRREILQAVVEVRREQNRNVGSTEE